MKKHNGHKSVMMRESIENMKLSKGSVVVDATLNGGGHASEILDIIAPDGVLIGIDKDSEALERSERRFAESDVRTMLIKDDFKNIKRILASCNIDKVDAIIADLGVSSYQLESTDRGFSYNVDAKLDMRMDTESPLSAYEVVNGYTTAALTRIFRDYGEERWASRIADFIVEERKNGPIETTLQLVDIIKNAIPAAARKEGPHPAKRVFQAIRIEVNGELSGLDNAMFDFADVLKSGGRLCVIRFHSLEDRIVKQAFKKLNDPCECPPGSPVCICGKKKTVEIITRKPIVPSEEELEENPRARSAKLRVIEKI